MANLSIEESKFLRERLANNGVALLIRVFVRFGVR